MNTKKDRQRLVQLREVVAYHRKRYHEEDSPEISDEAYDALLVELQNLELQVEGKVSESATIGGEVSEAFSKVKHAVKQWSFDNVFTEDELRDWDKRVKKIILDSDRSTDSLSYVAEHKIDGLKLVVEYKQGKLFRASTRGDGVTGENVTHTAKTISSLPKVLRKPIDLLCVGEVWLGEEEFERINKDRRQAGRSFC